ncbi:MAG TPA: hypothetical protein EYH34_03875 [Planctomycetes bacterium]|nr:hypothetical protein [Planctomycetota bacterium]
MKPLRAAAAYAILLTVTATTAWGQYGLYGAPQPIDLSRLDPQPGMPWGSQIASSSPLPSPTGTGVAPPSSPVWGAPLPPTGPGPGDMVRPVGESQGVAPPEVPQADQPASPTLVDQMLQESAPSGHACGPVPLPGYAFGGAAARCDPAVWYAYGSGLAMGRNGANRLWTTYETNAPENQLMNTQDIGMPWHGGWEVGLGRLLGCGTWALEASYWGLASVDGSTSSRSVFSGPVSTPLIVSNIQFGTDPGDPGTIIYGTDLFDNAAVHLLRRRNEVHNIEINLIRNRLFGGYRGLGCNWSMGIRFFRFEEALTFTSLAGDYDWDDDGGAWYAVLNDRVQNNLLGFQLGCDVNWDLGRRVVVYMTPSVGIYGNQINHDFQLYRGDGVVAVPDPDSGVTDTYPVSNSETALSFLTQVDVGLNWAFDDAWEALIGYRVVFVTGVALADHQIPTYVVDIPEIADIDMNGDLVYHGAYVGVVCRF